MTSLIRAIFILSSLSFLPPKKTGEQIIFDRIQFVFNLKREVENDVWETFNQKQFDVPLVYYTDTSSYIANPTKRFLQEFSSVPVYSAENLRIYKTRKRIDDIPFHMETGMSLGTPSDDYDYHSPFMKCSSFEVTTATVPGVLSTEEWITMVMHEYFHGFQYKHRSYLEYYEKNILNIQPDTLKSLYKNNVWFKQSIDRENDFLLSAINEKDQVTRAKLIDSFFVVRTERRAMTKDTFNFDIDQFEQCYESMEGTARYVEYSLYHKFSTMKPDLRLSRSDTSFKAFQKFRNYRIDVDKWLYLKSATTYYYATGFNMARLLDQLKVDYTSKMYKQGSLSLEQLLKTYRAR
jgi:hypothetical protein